MKDLKPSDKDTTPFVSVRYRMEVTHTDVATSTSVLAFSSLGDPDKRYSSVARDLETSARFR